MYYINKLCSSETVDFAAQELKKYLRMMMPEGGDVKIEYNPEAKDGFRLGLMQNLGLDVSDVDDCELDDIIYIDCDERGGIIAGDNPRSVLFAVYEYLKANGCRWLYPGVDGEYIPQKNITSVKRRHVPPMRYRGYAAEGSVYREAEIDFIDFMPKLGMNTYMIEFRIPRSYYEKYYAHFRNDNHRTPEPISDDLVLQWKRGTEAEIAKRGLQFHDIGHGWTVDPFGIDAKYAWEKIDESLVPKDMIKYLAELNGVRGLYDGRPANTQFCMSNPEARKLFADFVAKYAEEHSNIDFLHVWLADDINNHCECTECRKKSPSDYYMVLMNDIDKALTEKGLDTRIVFIAYLDTIFPPTVDKIENPDRFSLLIAPISRCYFYTRSKEGTQYSILPYERNNIKRPGALAHNIEYYKAWKKNFEGDGISFEYHFWRHLYYDLTGLQVARRVFEDIEYYHESDVRGIIENGTLRGFFPNGIALYTYAARMFDDSLTMDDITEDYYSHIYGEDYRDFIDYFEKINTVFPYSLISTNAEEGGLKKSIDFTAEQAKLLDEIDDILNIGRKLVREHYNYDERVRTVSVRLLEHHIDYVRYFYEAIKEKYQGNDDIAIARFDEFQEKYGEREIYIQKYFDHVMNFSGLGHLFRIKSNPFITD